MDSRKAMYGLPHIGARYVGKKYERTQEWCCVCGKPATNCHHIVPRGYGEVFETYTPHGTFQLKSPLLALCGSGTTGCHGRFHNGELAAVWSWDKPEFANAWETGELLERFAPHHRALYCYGQWEIKDKTTGKTIAYREEY